MAGLTRRSFALTAVLGLAWLAQPQTAASAPQEPGLVKLRFRGPVDGSDRIEIRDDGATWTNLHWAAPQGEVTMNGIRWCPSEQPELRNEGDTRFLPAAVDFRTARLHRIAGRDTVGLSCFADKVVVHLADTPPGPADYEFELVFHPLGASAELRIETDVDGSDMLRIDATAAEWTNLHWGHPKAPARLNGVLWDTERQPRLRNDGETQFLPAGVRFATARLVEQSGRDTAVVETGPDHVIVQFADNPPGPGRYVLRIRFGPRAPDEVHAGR